MDITLRVTARSLSAFISKFVSYCDGDTCPERCHPKPSSSISPKHGKVIFASEVHYGEQQLQPIYDVAVIGAGVVGCAIAYRLSLLHGIKAILVDENIDVGEGTSKSNSAIIHTGFDAEPGSLESKLLQEASAEWPILAKQLKIPYKAVGAVLVATNPEEESKLEDIIVKAEKNNVWDCRRLSKEQVALLEPQVSPHVTGGVLIPREAIADPFATPIAYAEVAVQNGVDICFGAKVHGISTNMDHTSGINNITFSPSIKDCPIKHSTTKLTIRAKHVINAAGLGSRILSESYDPNIAKELEINPRRGQFLVLQDGLIVSRIVLPMPNEITKGILVCPTIFGNTLCGPTAEDLPASACSDVPTCTTEGLSEVRRGAKSLVPVVANSPVVTTYAGHRCNRKGGSYFVHHDMTRGITTISGVRSTGLSTSPSFSRLIVNQIFPHHSSRHDALQYRQKYPPWYQHNHDGKDPVCSYENVSEEDIRQAIQSPLRPHTFDSIKRRTRALMGICQGSDCQDRVAEIIAVETGIKMITKCGCHSFTVDSSELH